MWAPAASTALGTVCRICYYAVSSTPQCIPLCPHPEVVLAPLWLFPGTSNSVFSLVVLVAAEAELVCTGAVGHQICAPSPFSPAEASHLNFFWALLAWATAVCCQGSCVLGLLVVTAQFLPALLWVKREGSRWALQSLHIKTTVNLCIFIGWA